MSNSIITFQNVLKSYEMLSSTDIQSKQKANIFLCNLVQEQQAWNIANKMIKECSNQHFKYLGSQILYQKIQRQVTHWLRPAQNHQQSKNIINLIKNLKDFCYQQIKISMNKACIDKLASCLSLILITTIIKGKQQNINSQQMIIQWKDLLLEIIHLMKSGDRNLVKGIIILERITQEIRICNKYSFKQKTICKQQLLMQEQMLQNIWSSTFNFAGSYDQKQVNSQIDPKALLLNLINCLESWVKSGFPLLKFKDIFSLILTTSTLTFQHLEAGSRVICQTLKATAQNKFQVLAEVHPQKQRGAYSQNQVLSLKIILDFVINHRYDFLPSSSVKIKWKNFHNPQNNSMTLIGSQSSSSNSKLDAEYSQLYVKIIDDILKNYSFLLFEDIGFQIMNLMLRATSSNDLKLSSQTFDYWIFLCQKMIKIKESSNQNRSPYLDLNSKIQEYLVQVYQIILQKTLIETDQILNQTQIRQEDTLDDTGSISFSEYRKEASDLFKALYDFFISNGVAVINNGNMPGAYLYFNSIYNLLKGSLGLNWRGVQLALFVIKSGIQSMIDEISTEYILNAISMILQLVRNTTAPAKVISQSMNLIRDCTREIKSSDSKNTGKNLFIECLKFVMRYMQDQKICNYSAYCFQILMQTIHTVDNQQLVKGLLDHYQNQKQNKKKQQYARAFQLRQLQIIQKDIIVQKVLQGVFNCIIKFENKEKVPKYLQDFMKIIVDYYNFKENLYIELQKQSQNNVNFNQQQTTNNKNKTAIFYDCLLELKTLLSCYQSITMDIQFKKISNGKFRQLCLHSLSIINKIFGSSLYINFSDPSQKIPQYSMMNQLGQSVSTYKAILKICTNTIPKNIKLDDGGISDQQIQHSYVQVMNSIMKVLDSRMIKQLCMMLAIISQTLIQFTPQSCKTSQNKNSSNSSSQSQININQFKRSLIINQWVIGNFPIINHFYLNYYSNFSNNYNNHESIIRHNRMDPDIVKYYFILLESLILYDRDLYVDLCYKDKQTGNMSQTNLNIINFAIFALKFVNEKQLVRRVVAFISIYVTDVICYKDQQFKKNLTTSMTASQELQRQKQRLTQALIYNIPQIPSPSHALVGKVLYLLFQNLMTIDKKEQIYSILLLRLIANSDRQQRNYNKNQIIPQNLSQAQHQNLKLLSKMFTMAIQYKTDRYIKLSFLLVGQVIKYFNGFIDQGAFIRNQVLMQIQMNTINWKREMKKLMQIQ